MARQVAAAPEQFGGLLVCTQRGRDDRQILQQVLDITDEAGAALDRHRLPIGGDGVGVAALGVVGFPSRQTAEKIP